MSDPVTRLNSALEGRYVVEREVGEGGLILGFQPEAQYASAELSLTSP